MNTPETFEIVCRSCNVVIATGVDEDTARDAAEEHEATDHIGEGIDWERLQ